MAKKDNFFLTRNLALFCFSIINHVFPFELHYTMFLPAIERLATEAQKEKWLPLARSFKWIGTYAQTEIGHGNIISKSFIG